MKARISREQARTLIALGVWVAITLSVLAADATGLNVVILPAGLSLF